MRNIDLTRVISDLLSGEMADQHRLSTLDCSVEKLLPDTELARGALNVDSSELSRLALLVSEMFHLRGTGAEERLLQNRTIASWSKIIAASLESRFQNITFRTSGSTGDPKRCVHRYSNLEEEAAEHARELMGCRRILSLVPSHHIYGFIFTVLIPAAVPMVVVDVRRWAAARIGAELRTGDVLIAVPSSWRALLEFLDLVPSGVAGVTSGAPCPTDLFASLSSDGIRIRDVYGSSETGGIGVKLAPARAFELMQFWRVDDEHRISRGSGALALTADVPDTLVWESDRRFQVGRRQDGAVQVFGFNVYPERVAGVIRSYPAIQDCAVRLMSSHEGDRLKAFVVWREHAGERDRTEAALKRWLGDHLQPREQPGSFTFGERLPVNSMRKAVDWVIRN